MKKNYIAPSTVAATWASMGLMQEPQIGFAAVSGTPGSATISNKDLID